MTIDNGAPATAAARIAQVERLYRLIDAGDFGPFAALFDEQAIHHRPDSDVLVGRAEIARFYAEKRTIKSGRHTLNKIIINDRDIAVHGSFSGTLTDGREHSHRFAEFFELSADGLFSRRDSFIFTSPF